MSRYRAVDGELEDELGRELEDEFEFEDEFEDELEGLAHELEDEDEFEDEDFYEFEDEYEDEDELEDELEDEFDAEFEDELEALIQELEDELEDEDEFEDEDEYEEEFEALVRELEGEFEFEAEYEDEGFANPARRVYPDAELMANLAFQAEQAETEDEVEGFLAPLVGLAARGLPRLAPVIRKAAPMLRRGIGKIGRRLWKGKGRRKIRKMPMLLKKAAQRLKRKPRSQGPLKKRKYTGARRRPRNTNLARRRNANASRRASTQRNRRGAQKKRTTGVRQPGRPKKYTGKRRKQGPLTLMPGAVSNALISGAAGALLKPLGDFASSLFEYPEDEPRMRPARRNGYRHASDRRRAQLTAAVRRDLQGGRINGRRG
ncbi:hypothetical protein AB0H34_28820 [Saccharopolyspora shandongensis]|uniref:hypothetical protein n=1 Tax=Saccharopolyspora shandongensis TaxID=418495 RepID=UPI0033CFE0DE